MSLYIPVWSYIPAPLSSTSQRLRLQACATIERFGYFSMKNNSSYYNILFKIRKLSLISYFMAWDQTTIHWLIFVFYSKFLPPKPNLISSITYTCYIALIFFSSKPLFFLTLTFWRALANFFTECFSIFSVLSPMMTFILSRNMARLIFLSTSFHTNVTGCSNCDFKGVFYLSIEQ